jgi:hypothetical protein
VSVASVRDAAPSSSAASFPEPGRHEGVRGTAIGRLVEGELFETMMPDWW